MNLKKPPKVHTKRQFAEKRRNRAIKGDLQMFIDQAGMNDELAPAQAVIKALED